jgi:hypothetical protein
MKSRMTWPELCDAAELKGSWVALDNCRYDSATLQATEGDVVDWDAELVELCSRLREMGRTSCAIVFCEDDMIVQARHSGPRSVGARNGAAR